MATDKRAERRQKRRKGSAAGRPANYSQLYKDENKLAAADGGSDSADGDVTLGRKGSESVDWQGEYHHVLRDLRLLLLISLVIFVVMIGGGYLL